MFPHSVSFCRAEPSKLPAAAPRPRKRVGSRLRSQIGPMTTTSFRPPFSFAGVHKRRCFSVTFTLLDMSFFLISGLVVSKLGASGGVGGGRPLAGDVQLCRHPHPPQRPPVRQRHTQRQLNHSHLRQHHPAAPPPRLIGERERERERERVCVLFFAISYLLSFSRALSLSVLLSSLNLGGEIGRNGAETERKGEQKERERERKRGGTPLTQVADPVLPSRSRPHNFKGTATFVG